MLPNGSKPVIKSWSCHPAMSGETNRLLGLAKDVNPNAADLCPREMDMIASTGEQVSVGLLAIA